MFRSRSGLSRRVCAAPCPPPIDLPRTQSGQEQGKGALLNAVQIIGCVYQRCITSVPIYAAQSTTQRPLAEPLCTAQEGPSFGWSITPSPRRTRCIARRPCRGFSATPLSCELVQVLNRRHSNRRDLRLRVSGSMGAHRRWSSLLPTELPARLWTVTKSNWHLGVTAFGGPPVHFKIVWRSPVPATTATVRSVVSFACLVLT